MKRKRVQAPDLRPDEFPTDVKDAMKHYELQVEKMKIDEEAKGFGFRSHRRGGGRRK